MTQTFDNIRLKDAELEFMVLPLDVEFERFIIYAAEAPDMQVEFLGTTWNEVDAIGFINHCAERAFAECLFRLFDCDKRQFVYERNGELED